MDAINLMNYKLIYEFAWQAYESYGSNAKHMGTGFSKEKYQKMGETKNKARHLYIRKMREFLAQERANAKRDGHEHLDLGFEIDPESYLLAVD